MENHELVVKVAGQDEPARRAYAPPRLMVHGSAAKLTANLDTGANDVFGGSALDP
jgi:hypothetical protein